MALSITNIANLLFKGLQGKSSTTDARQFFEEPRDGRIPIYPTQVWNQEADIPSTAPTLADQAISGVVQYWEDLVLTAVPGTTNAFSSDNLRDAIPFNFGDGSYNYEVKDSLGGGIAFGLGDWIVDNATGTLTFYGTVPANMPPSISFYKYVGTKGVGSGSGGGGGSRLNLFDDGSFEEETVDEFTILGTGTLSAIAAELATPSNLFMLEADMDAGDNLEKNFATGADYENVPGKFSGWIKTPEVIVIELDVDGALAETLTIEASTEWQKFEIPFTFGATNVVIDLGNTNAAVYYLDELYIGALSESEYILPKEVYENTVEDFNKVVVFGEDKNFVGGMGLWTSYDDGDVDTPVDGVGGTPDGNFVVQYDTINVDPFGTNFSMRLNNLAATNLRGNGRSVDILLKPYLKGNFCEFGIFHDSFGTDYVDGTFKLFVYDVTNSRLLDSLTDGSVPKAPGKAGVIVYVPESCDEVRLIIHIARVETTFFFDKLFKGTYFDLASRVNIPITQEQTISLASSGNFTGGSIRVARAGSLVTINAIDDITFASASAPASAAGVIPEWARPLNSQNNVSITSTSQNITVSVNSAGTLAFAIRDWAGATSNATTARPSISYTVASQGTLNGLASQSILGKGRAVKSSAQSVTTTPTTLKWDTFTDSGTGLTYSVGTGQFTATRRVQLLVLAQLGYSNLTAGKQFNLRVNGSNINLNNLDNNATTETISIHDIVTLNVGDTIDTTVATASSSVNTEANAARSFIQFLEYPFSDTSVFSAPFAELVMSTSPGRGSTNVVVLRYTTELVNTASAFVTNTASATLGHTFAILQTGNYELSMQYQSSDSNREFGITRNCTTLTTNIASVAPSQVIVRGTAIASRSNTITKTVKLTAGDVIRGQDDQGTLVTTTDFNRFSIKFMGYST